jgi:hypothetical protein
MWRRDEPGKPPSRSIYSGRRQLISTSRFDGLPDRLLLGGVAGPNDTDATFWASHT